MIKVSVIIPVYNVEPYLRECLDSIINQTLKDIEIICIDDCSTDNSYSILEEYAKKDNRIVIIKNEENMGVGYTRNVGEKLAKGEYIHFMDPDDCISLNFYECMYNTGKKYNSDVVNIKNIINIEKSYLNKTPKYHNKEYEADVGLNNIYNFKDSIYFTLWSKLLKTSFLLENNILSRENKKGAAYDADFVFRLLLYKPKASFNTGVIYYYRSSRKDSIVNSLQTNGEYFENIINNYKDTISLFKKNDDKLLDLLYINIIDSILYCFNKLSIKNMSIKYYILHDFVKDMHIDYNKIDTTLERNTKYYLEYISLKTSENYDQYLFNKTALYKVNNCECNIKKTNNWFRFFGINNSKDYLVIILFGIKICIKKY
ncbi:glycosyltransferase family A protein [Brachyspira sp. SAP_772]|uniref:glycosyltransferase family 2 protein n=1 Tax=Brachyspira sp. SAP_772 TaxID=2608385 RepID=UPI0012F4EC90|nr:glycosyltransferase family A protein [Brachyspira sp. SAP_772]